MNKIEKQIEFLINIADYDKILNLLEQEDYKQMLAEEDYYFYKGYCLIKLEDEKMANDALPYFIKVLSVNSSVKYKDSIRDLIADICFNENYYIELDNAKEFVNNLREILPPNDIFIIKIFQYFFWMGIYSPEEFIEIIDSVLKFNKSNPEIYEIRADLCCDWDTNSAIKNLQTALLLNKKAKDRYLKKIRKLKEQE